MNNLKSTPLYYRAPSTLHDQIRSSAIQFVKEQNLPSKALSSHIFHWLRLLSAPMTAALLFLVFNFYHRYPSNEELIAQEIVASHVRSLMGSNHLIDVVSSEKHTVKPWFNGKLDFSPTVPDLSENGFKLLGGRLDYLSNRAIAALVYQIRQHTINLLIWPSTQATDEQIKFVTRQGYSIFHWTHHGMEYWTTSDLNANELKQFSELVQRATNK